LGTSKKGVRSAEKCRRVKLGNICGVSPRLLYTVTPRERPTTVRGCGKHKVEKFV